MKPIIKGFIIGFLLKDKIQQVCKGILFNGLNLFHEIKNKIHKKDVKDDKLIQEIYFVFKVTNQESFDEHFKNNETNVIKLQPRWDYYENKKIIKIQLDDDFIDYLNNMSNYNISFNDFINIKNKNEHYVTLDIPFFESFGKIYLYVHYLTNSKNYINVYDGNSNICSDDFNLVRTDFREFLDNVICASVKYKINTKIKNEYITNYIKMFINNKTDLTPELILNNYDKLDIDLTNIKLNIITVTSENKDYLINNSLKKEEQFKD